VKKLSIIAGFLIALVACSPARAQVYETTCPAGSSPTNFGTTRDPTNNQLKQNICVDATGNFIYNGVSSGATVANASSVIANGLAADYRLLTGSGTTAFDSSGNGNDATFCAGGQAPTWLSPGPGVRFGPNYTAHPCLSLPIGLTSVLGAAGGATIQILFFFDPYDGTIQNVFNPYFCLICSNGNGANSHSAGIVLAQVTGNLTVNDAAYFVDGMATNTGSSTLLWADTNTTWSGTGVLTFVSNPGGADSLYINGKPMGLGAVNALFNSGAPFTGNFFLGYPATGFTFANVGGAAMNYYRVVIYSRQLAPGEIFTNTQTMNYFAGQTSLVPTMPCCMGAVAQPIGTPASDKQDQIVMFADSIGITNATNWMSFLTLNGGPWSFVNSSEPGNTLANFVKSSPYSEDSLFRPFGGRNIMLLMYGNDMVGAGLTGYQQYQQAQVTGTRALSAGWQPAMVTLPTRGSAGFDTQRDAFNANVRAQCPNIVWAPICVDAAADLNLGVDGGSSVATYFPDGTHLSATALYNNFTLMVGRQANRWFGNKTFSSANTYTASGTNTIATTAASEAGNLATITVAAVGPCVAGAEVTVAGITPAGYNTPAGQDGWYIRSNTATTITFYDFNTGLGAQTVAGTIHCPQQVDADDHLILGGAAAGPVFYLQSCIGQTQPTYISVTNTNASPWVLTPWLSTQTINGAATMNAPVATATNHQVVELDPIFSGSVTAGCTWQAHVQ
jgi:hypothetical protein